MYRLAAFDLDSTLAELGRGVLQADMALLRELEARGTTVAICSGKSVDYLTGFARQMNLTRPVLIGENGAVVQIGVDLPPKGFYVLPYSEKAKRSISLLKEMITERLPHIWFQADMVGITPFPTTDEEFAIVEDCISSAMDGLEDIDIFRHCDSVDIVPRGTNKGRGLKFLCELLEIEPSQVAAIGDGSNDYPMFDFAGLALGVNVKDKSKVDIDFPTAGEAITYLINI